MTLENSINALATYTIIVVSRDLEGAQSNHTDILSCARLSTAKAFSKRVIKCVDAVSVDVINDLTGEVMWCQYENGEIYEAET